MFFSRKKKKRLGKPQNISERVATLLRANIHAALDRAEDPETLLNQFVRDYTENIAETEVAVAETIGHLRLMQRDSEAARQGAADWQLKAIAASSRADRHRDGGNTAEADRFDKLATTALHRQIAAERRVSDLAPQISNQERITEQLKNGLNEMRERLVDLKNKRSELLSRAKVAEAQNRVVDAVTALNASDPTSELSRFEGTVRQQEALAQGRVEIAASSMDAQFDELEILSYQQEASDRLAALKGGATPPRIFGKQGAQ